MVKKINRMNRLIFFGFMQVNEFKNKKSIN